MATVVNVATIRPLIQQLGWETLNVSEALEAIKKAGISPVAVLAYLRALSTTADGLDDQAIDGCPPAAASEITAYLADKGVVASG